MAGYQFPPPPAGGITPPAATPQPRLQYITLRTPIEALGLEFVYSNEQDTMIIQVDPGSPADVAELQPGWKIVELNGDRITTPQDLRNAMGKVRAAQLTRIPIKTQQPWNPETNTPATPRLEFTVQVSPGEQLGLAYEEVDIAPSSCVLRIGEVVPGAAAAKAGVVAGLDLVRCNDVRVHTKDDLQACIERSGVKATGGTVALEFCPSTDAIRQLVAQRDLQEGELLDDDFGGGGEEEMPEGEMDAMMPDEFVDLLRNQLVQTKLALKRMHEEVDHAQRERDSAEKELDEARGVRQKERVKRDRRKAKSKSDGLYRALGKLIIRHEKDYWGYPQPIVPGARPYDPRRRVYGDPTWAPPAIGPPPSIGQPPPGIGLPNGGHVGGFGRAAHLTGLPYESSDVAPLPPRSRGVVSPGEADRLWREGWSSAAGQSRMQTHRDSWGHPARRWP